MEKGQLDFSFGDLPTKKKVWLEGKDGHYLKSRSSLVVVILRSLRHGSCVVCGHPLKSLEDSGRHWYEMMGWDYDEFKVDFEFAGHVEVEAADKEEAIAKVEDLDFQEFGEHIQNHNFGKNYVDEIG